MPAPKTPDQITATFNALTAHIINETAAHYLSDTKLYFVDQHYSFARCRENAIYFSMVEYYHDFNQKSIIEYKKVLRRIKMPFYCDCGGYYRILTPEPEIYTLIHEISHIITHVINEGAPAHGEEFCDVYLQLIEMVEPKTLSPINGGMIGWSN